MLNADWYKKLKVNRVKHPDGRLKHIDINTVSLNGDPKLIRIMPGSTNEHLADIIVGLQWELDRVQEAKRVDDELEVKIH